MQLDLSPVQAFVAARNDPAFDLVANVRGVLARANGNLSRNSYISLDEAWTLAEAERASLPEDRRLLRGLAVSLKDCFDLEGFRTSCGSKFYAAHNRIASRDSAVAERLRREGVVITGKTHLHQLAYGITGENRDYGNCVQPRDGALLTGGSSSGAAASVQEGSALAAIGTDTGGSIRVPAALCGLAGYRASHGVADWRGGAHLAPSFDTVGWLFRDLRDGPVLAETLFDLPEEKKRGASAIRVGVLGGPMIEECDAAVLRSYALWQERLRADGAVLEEVSPEFWSGAWDIYAPLQAVEASKLHAGFYEHFEPTIAARLEWGASLSEEEVHALRMRLEEFREATQGFFLRFDYLLAPATPVSRLEAAKDQTEARARILRHTTPASLTGLPAVVLPSADCGLQLLAAKGNDRNLLRYAAKLGD